MRKKFILTAFLFCFIGATHAQAENWCYARSLPHINIVPKTDEIIYDFSKSEKQLNNFKIDTENPYGADVITDVGGLMQGGINLSHNTSLGYVTNNRDGLSCMWYDMINIEIGIKPTIYIAREYNKGTCMHNAIMEHEQKHITVDRKIVNEYANKIGYRVNEILEHNYLYGPFPTNSTTLTKDKMIAEVNAIIQGYAEELKHARRAAQQQVDSIEEYEHVRNKCLKQLEYLKRKKR